MPAKLLKKKVVHLGNVDGEPLAEKSKRYAKRFPSFRFVGIDMKKLKGVHPANMTQVRTGFLKGLTKLDDASVRVISSEMAFGMSASSMVRGLDSDKEKRYDKKVLKLAYKKLEPSGKFFVAIDAYNLVPFKEALKESGLQFSKVEIRKFRENEYGRTPWTREMKPYPIIYQVTLVKP